MRYRNGTKILMGRLRSAVGLLLELGSMLVGFRFMPTSMPMPVCGQPNPFSVCYDLSQRSSSHLVDWWYRIHDHTVFIFNPPPTPNIQLMIIDRRITIKNYKEDVNIQDTLYTVEYMRRESVRA